MLCAVSFANFFARDLSCSRVSEKILEQFETGGEIFMSSFHELWHAIISAAEDENAGEMQSMNAKTAEGPSSCKHYANYMTLGSSVVDGKNTAVAIPCNCGKGYSVPIGSTR